jgi:hypothetical protein
MTKSYYHMDPEYNYNYNAQQNNADQCKRSRMVGDHAFLLKDHYYIIHIQPVWRPRFPTYVK